MIWTDRDTLKFQSHLGGGYSTHLCIAQSVKIKFNNRKFVFKSVTTDRGSSFPDTGSILPSRGG